MLFELREYQCKPGKRDEFVRYMEETLIPLQVSLGVVVVGSFIDEEDPNRYVWIRRFDSEEERLRIYEALYGTDAWENQMLPVVVGMLHRERSVISRLVATPKSVLR